MQNLSRILSVAGKVLHRAGYPGGPPSPGEMDTVALGPSVGRSQEAGSLQQQKQCKSRGCLCRQHVCWGPSLESLWWGPCCHIQTPQSPDVLGSEYGQLHPHSQMGLGAGPGEVGTVPVAHRRQAAAGGASVPPEASSPSAMGSGYAHSDSLWGEVGRKLPEVLKSSKRAGEGALLALLRGKTGTLMSPESSQANLRFRVWRRLRHFLPFAPHFPL